MFIDTNPIPVKKAVELLGMAGGPVRLPLDDLDEKKTEQLKKILATIPKKATIKSAALQKKTQKPKAGKNTTPPKLRTR
jgi:4-hydroxy-tetrahydrodipicolinate synthase